MTANVISRRSFLAGSASITGRYRLGCIGPDRREYAACGEVEQRLLVGISPPAGEPAAPAVADNDQVCPYALCSFRDVLDRIAVDQVAVRAQATFLEPRDTFVEYRVGAILITLHERLRITFGRRCLQHAAAYRQQ